MNAKPLLRHPGTLQVAIPYEEAGGTEEAVVKSIHNTLKKASNTTWAMVIGGAVPEDNRVLWTLDGSKARLYFRLVEAENAV